MNECMYGGITLEEKNIENEKEERSIAGQEETANTEFAVVTEETESEGLVIEEEAAEQEIPEEVQETETVDVESKLTKQDKEELLTISYEHARDTMKKGDKIDWFVLGCGLFAIICLIVSVVNVIRYGFDWLFGLMMLAYVLVAVFCLVKKLQYVVGKALWKIEFSGKLVAKKAEDYIVRFGEKELAFTTGKEHTVLYENLFDVYESENFYIFHINDRCIIPVAKTAVAEAEKEYEGEDLKAYFEKIIDEYHHQVTEETSEEAATEEAVTEEPVTEEAATEEAAKRKQ